jgi:fructose-bisphosphate aldolase class II
VTPGCEIDFDRLEQIAAVVKTPLVIHGTSGIYEDDIRKLAKYPSICKFNIGTSLRKVFGQSLRKTLSDNPDEFDRLTIFEAILPAMQAEADRHMRLLGAVGKANQ